MLGIGQLFILSLGVFSLLAWIISSENRKGHRVFLTSLREKLDAFIDKATIIIAHKLTYLGRHIIKLSWYYGIHKFLRFTLSGLVKVYDVLEAAFMENRERARTLKIEKKAFRSESGHLSQMAEHKVSTALTDTQKKRLLQKKLERG